MQQLRHAVKAVVAGGARWKSTWWRLHTAASCWNFTPAKNLNVLVPKWMIFLQLLRGVKVIAKMHPFKKDWRHEDGILWHEKSLNKLWGRTAACGICWPELIFATGGKAINLVNKGVLGRGHALIDLTKTDTRSCGIWGEGPVSGIRRITLSQLASGSCGTLTSLSVCHSDRFLFRCK